MHIVTLGHEEDFEGWREAARALALQGVPAEDVRWEVGGAPQDLFAGQSAPPAAAEGRAFSVPRAFLTLARSVVRHTDPERFALLYALLLRLRARPDALADGASPLVQRLERLAREARGKEMEPIALMARGDTNEAAMAQGAAHGIGDNARAAWESVRAEAMKCTRCHLYKLGTQTVFGEGPIDAPLMLVGEQPGDQEDLAGRPFVGPAGQVLDRALADAGIERARTYITNAVKHFKFEPRGKRRIHQKPDGPEIEACRWWIEQERLLIRPTVTVAMGTTAARALFGKSVTITSTRCKPYALYDGGETWVTVHPSYLLRIPDAARKADEYARFVEDLARVRQRLAVLAE